ncbi:MAG: hypothetical protein QOF90_439 [Acetobacteraceae bacterium]|nr:hypothetical protein [Acetobacteraceae bacterium]
MMERQRRLVGSIVLHHPDVVEERAILSPNASDPAIATPIQLSNVGFLADRLNGSAKSMAVWEIAGSV